MYVSMDNTPVDIELLVYARCRRYHLTEGERQDLSTYAAQLAVAQTAGGDLLEDFQLEQP